jgi:hypothetical protein
VLKIECSAPLQGEQIQTRVSANLLKPYLFDLQTNNLTRFLTMC